MDTNIKTSSNREVGPITNFAGFLLMYALWIAIVLGWRSFLGAEGDLAWLVHRLFG